MNKALPWNINGVGFDAREAAREAARRQGKSLGEWLHGVIADHAAERGVDEDEVVGRDRIDAVTSRLERMSARGSFDRRSRDDRQPERARPARSSEDDAFDLVGSRGRRATTRGGERPSTRPMIEETEFLLEEAIDAMERRAVRTDDAIASLAAMLEKNEARRDSERVSVTVLTQKLGEIEGRLAEAGDESPIKGALARLEARLETIAGRDVAEGVAKPSAIAADRAFSQQNGAGTADTGASEPIRRLESKLNALLEAVSAGGGLTSGTSPIAIAASREAEPRQRRLGDAIAEIADRQRTLDESAGPLRGRPRPLREARRETDGARQADALAAMQGDIGALTTKIDDLHRSLASPARAEATRGIDHLQAQIEAMAKMIGETAAQTNRREARQAIERLRDDTPAIGRVLDQMREIKDIVAAQAPVRVDLEPIESRIAALTEQLNEQARKAPDLTDAHAQMSRTIDGDIRSLESLIRDLGAKIEAVRAPDAGSQSIDALQDQLALLASRFERSEEGLSSLSTLQQSMKGLFAHLDETRASIEMSAAQAARDAVRLASEESRFRSDDVTIAAMKAIQDDADARTQATLDAVRLTLNTVVGRLSSIEGDIADGRSRPNRPEPPVRAAETVRPAAPRPAPASAPVAKEARPEMVLGAPDPYDDPMLGGRAAAGKAKAALPPKVKPVDADEAGRADFIAAARRAAHAAQADGSTIGAQAGDRDLRAGLVAKSRDYVASHKRPVLLSLAALFVVLGTMAVMQRMGFDDGASDVASYVAPAKIVKSAALTKPVAMKPMQRIATAEAPRPAEPPAASPDLTAELTPSALPKPANTAAASIPGSDPIQTGSIPSLPSFAARGAIAPSIPKSPMPAGLMAMADAGNGAAEYEVATRYADGKLVPRDLKLAATWFEKAASQGLAPAQYRLASLYEKGLGVPQDKQRAKILYLKAADAGNPRAMHNLAVLLADGNGKPDYDAAATWFRKAAQYGVHDSQYNLAILLARGLGLQQSMVQSYQWFAIAAAQNDPDAASKRDEVAAKLSPSDLAVAKALVAAFHARVADLAATEVRPPAGGWDGAPSTSPLNSARSKISSL